jgi:translation initiation factor 5A
MAELNDYDFSTTDAGSSLTYPSEAGQIKKGGFMMIKDRPCKVINISTSKTGKHGHAKCNFTAVDIFNGKKCEDIVPSTHNCMVPTVERKEYTLLDIAEDGFISLMDDTGDQKEDMKLPEYPEDLADKIKTAFDEGKSLLVTVLSACAVDQVIDFKEEAGQG